MWVCPSSSFFHFVLLSSGPNSTHRPLRSLVRRQHRRRLERRLQVEGCDPDSLRLVPDFNPATEHALLIQLQHDTSEELLTCKLTLQLSRRAAGYEYFDVWAPEIATHYGQVFWTDQGVTPIPADIVKRFDGKVHSGASAQQLLHLAGSCDCFVEQLSPTQPVSPLAGDGHHGL